MDFRSAALHQKRPISRLIFRGVASVDNRLVLAGAIPAALLALAADAALGLLERRFRMPGK